MEAAQRQTAQAAEQAWAERVTRLQAELRERAEAEESLAADLHSASMRVRALRARCCLCGYGRIAGVQRSAPWSCLSVGELVHTL